MKDLIDYASDDVPVIPLVDDAGQDLLTPRITHAICGRISVRSGGFSSPFCLGFGLCRPTFP